MPLEDFLIQQELGKGSFGTVWKCKRKVDGNVYAMKQVKIDKLKQKDRVNALNEVRILASIVSPNIVEYKEAFFDEATTTLCVVMEYADQGDLQSKIKAHIKKGTRFEEKQIWQMAFDLLQGLKKLHDSNIIHRDIKTANVFISGGHGKLGDLNISKIVKNQMATTQTGTPLYASPEIWSDTPYGPKTDIWSLGCVIYEMCVLKQPFRAANFQGLFKKVMAGQYQKIPSVYSSNLALFIGRCLTVSERRRASIQELLNNKMFRQLELTTEYYDEPEDQQNEMLGTIQLPKNYAKLNEVLPTPKYQAGRSLAKLKTVTIIQAPPDLVNLSRKRLPSAQKIRSEKLLPALPTSTKVLPAPEPLKPLNNNLTPKNSDSVNKGVRIHKAIRSHKLIQLD